MPLPNGGDIGAGLDTVNGKLEYTASVGVGVSQEVAGATNTVVGPNLADAGEVKGMAEGALRDASNSVHSAVQPENLSDTIGTMSGTNTPSPSIVREEEY